MDHHTDALLLASRAARIAEAAQRIAAEAAEAAREAQRIASALTPAARPHLQAALPIDHNQPVAVLSAAPEGAGIRVWHAAIRRPGRSPIGLCDTSNSGRLDVDSVRAVAGLPARAYLCAAPGCATMFAGSDSWRSPTTGRRATAEELLVRRVAAVKQACPGWMRKLPSQARIGEVIGATGGAATSAVRKQLAADRGEAVRKKKVS